MEHEILITDLTAMHGDRVCIAGVDSAGQTLRPILRYGVRRHHLLHDGKALIRPRAVLGMRLVPKRAASPHVEDHDWRWLEWTRGICILNETCWQQRLEKLAEDCPRPLFGASLQCHKGARRRKLRQHSASFSLATLNDIKVCSVVYAPHRSSPYRLSFRDSHEETYDDIPITDLALLVWACARVRQGQSPVAVSACFARRLESAQQIILRVGLSRNYFGWCWFQVNGVYTFPDWLEGNCFADFADAQKRLL